MSCVFPFCSGFLPTKLFPLMSLQWRGWCLAAFDFFKDSVHLLEERLPKVSAELLYNIRNGETNFISFSCLPWERKAVKHESRCVHRVLCAIWLWKLGQLHLSISKGAGELRPPFWEQDVRDKAISLVKTVFLEQWIPIKWGDRKNVPYDKMFYRKNVKSVFSIRVTAISTQECIIISFL